MISNSLYVESSIKPKRQAISMRPENVPSGPSDLKRRSYSVAVGEKERHFDNLYFNVSSKKLAIKMMHARSLSASSSAFSAFISRGVMRPLEYCRSLLIEFAVS